MENLFNETGPRTLSPQQITALNQRGLYLAQGDCCDLSKTQRYSIAWSSHEGRWESSAAHIDLVLREIQAGNEVG